ncbi:primase-helicase family protein [Aureimonas altamirensis]|uniref:primase-helicase family protein n=1 Tax=Aureimonas altamirensis TaxID=370622 RepID=UPI0025538852|nr:primase-helicase family protein [Aureimonas altamirensis]
MTISILHSLWELPAAAAYLSRIGGKWTSFTRAVVQDLDTSAGWQSSNSPRDIVVLSLADSATPAISPAWESDADPEDYRPTDAEKAAIAAEWMDPAKRPTSTFVMGTPAIPAEILADGVKREDCYTFQEFRKVEGKRTLVTTMIEARKKVEIDGEERKIVKKWTPFSDGHWRAADPDGLLPIFNIHRVKPGSYVVVCEGPKDAAIAQRFADMALGEVTGSRAEQAAFEAHPWGAQFGGYVFVAWAGGANAWHRTNWERLLEAKPHSVWLVGDNDSMGRRAISGINGCLEKATTWRFNWDSTFPAKFGLGDPFPDAARSGTKSLAFKDYFELTTPPVVWKPVKVGKEVVEKAFCNYAFANAFAFTSRNEIFFLIDKPSIAFDADELCNHFQTQMASLPGKQLAADVKKIRSVERLYDQVWAPMAYKDATGAGYEKRRVRDETNGTVRFNKYRPTSIRAVQGDVSPFMDYMAHLIPDVDERSDVLRMTATLIARADRRLNYALALLSTTGGTGKSTYLEKIVIPLVGSHNVIPTQPVHMFGPTHNGWRIDKRLVAISEFDCGNLNKAELEDKFKDVITANYARGRRMYADEAMIETNLSIILTDNSRVPFPLSMQDRRWFAPTVTEEKFSMERYNALNKWLDGPGLSAILAWACSSYSDDIADDLQWRTARDRLREAEATGDRIAIADAQRKFTQCRRAYVQVGEEAPMTTRKRQWQAESKSENVMALDRLASTIVNYEGPVAVTAASVKDWLAATQPGLKLKEANIKETLALAGCHLFNRDKSEQRIDIDGRRSQYVLMNPALSELANQGLKPKELGTYLKCASDLMPL